MKTTDELIEQFIDSEYCHTYRDNDREFIQAYIDGGNLVMIFRYYREDAEYRQSLLDYLTFLHNLNTN